MPLKVPFMVCVMCSHGHAGVGTLGAETTRSYFRGSCAPPTLKAGIDTFIEL